MMLEVLDRPLMLFDGDPASECSEVSSFARARVGFAGIQPVFCRAEFADHGGFPFLPHSFFVAASIGAVPGSLSLPKGSSRAQLIDRATSTANELATAAPIAIDQAKAGSPIAEISVASAGK
jgi:hypothetical protein